MITLYHNPRCSKSRAAFTLLQEQGVAAEVVEYLKTPPTPKQLADILHMLDLEPRGLMRKQEAPYKEAGLDNPELSNDELIAAMIANPILIERPIVVANGKAAIGRPPENVLAILS